MASPAEALERLLSIMAALRSPGGCAWDAAQTPASLKPYLLEESYEVLEALDHDDPAAICDELGDLLLQIVFLARIFEERDAFGFADVAAAIADKLERRHPHVFGTVAEGDDADHHRRWEAIKQEELARRGISRDTLLGIPTALPGLLRARKTIQKSARTGHDWPSAAAAHLTATAALAALGHARLKGDHAALEQALGELLMAVSVELRDVSIDPEGILQRRVSEQIRTLSQGGRAPLASGAADDMANAGDPQKGE